jgi:hypothetical protein
MRISASRLDPPAGTEVAEMTLEIEDKNVKNQYELLNILDGKASALLTFNAIFLTSLSVWLGYIPLNFFHLTLDIVFLALLISCALLLQVIWLQWSTLKESAQALESIRRKRTMHYHRAWKIAKYCIMVVVLVSLVHSVGTILTALKACTGFCGWFFGDAVFGNLDYGGR